MSLERIGNSDVMTLLSILLFLLSQIITVAANTEKAIFLGPSIPLVSVDHPTVEDLHVDILSPQNWSLRTHIQAQFPNSASEYGQSSWLLLHGLREGQRYEVRICWAANQPTSFRLETYELPTVLETPDLNISLSKYSEARQLKPIENEYQRNIDATAVITSKPTFERSSIMFLHVLAAADYFTMNKTYMKQVPPVFVDIVLDPYVFNLFPRSLGPTALYIVVLAVGSWVLSKYVSKWVLIMAKDELQSERKKK